MLSCSSLTCLAHRCAFNLLSSTTFFRSLKRRAGARSALNVSRKGNNMGIKPQNFDYFLVLDFEATCDAPSQLTPMEIIEFPVLKLNGQTFEVESTFHTYVKPKTNPQLTAFCVDLTGILQDQVDNAPTFDKALELFNSWMLTDAKLITESGEKTKSFTFVTFGNWDLQIMLPKQCQLSHVAVPPYAQSWINLKKSVAEATRIWPNGLKHMLSQLNIEQVGRIHSGIDDCRNIINGMTVLAQNGYVFKETSVANA